METVKNMANQASESVQGATASGQKEADKSTAKDSNQPIGERASAAKDAVGNKMDEQKHDVGHPVCPCITNTDTPTQAKSEAHKQS
ncbi:MAG: hypothetical protein L6R40_000691 [Gallowayella cf. fulva]|nr:MAG: hypothetical protein L6R40_000691 [Xanthomendoza cf. fulva]